MRFTCLGRLSAPHADQSHCYRPENPSGHRRLHTVHCILLHLDRMTTDLLCKDCRSGAPAPGGEPHARRGAKKTSRTVSFRSRRASGISSRRSSPIARSVSNKCSRAPVQHVADHGDRGHVVVRRAAAAKARPEFLPVRLFLRSQAFGGEDLLGDGDVHQLPANVRPARSRSPSQNSLGIGFLLDAIEQPEGAGRANSRLLINNSVALMDRSCCGSGSRQTILSRCTHGQSTGQCWPWAS